jgi:hypothetical protein
MNKQVNIFKTNQKEPPSKNTLNGQGANQPPKKKIGTKTLIKIILAYSPNKEQYKTSCRIFQHYNLQLILPPLLANQREAY